MPTHKGPARNRQPEELWRRIVTGQVESGVSIREWCQRQEMSMASFYAWCRSLVQRGIRRRAATEKRRARLVAVEVVPPISSVASMPRALVMDGFRIEIASDFDEDAFRRLLSMLRVGPACGASPAH